MQRMRNPSGSPPRKRPRSISVDTDLDFTLIDVDAPKVVRDPVYYKPSGDCKIRVEDTLFSIHRFLLEQAGSIFETMFQLPQGAKKPQGSSDEDPIILIGDTLYEFRALCWALYALPDEITRESTRNNSMEKLTRVATIAHKYQLTAFQSWAMASIREQCTTFYGSLGYLSNCPIHMLSALLRVFILYADDPFRLDTQKTWVSRLSPNNVHPHPLPLSAFSDALDLAERYSLRHFLGRLYYTRLIAAHSALAKNSTSTSAMFPGADDLEPRHLQRVLQGAWSLSGYWQRLYTTIPRLPTDTCEHHARHCRPEWNKLWQQAGAHGSAADVLGKLKYLSTQLGQRNANMDPMCGPKGKAIVTSLTAQLVAALPDHFLGPP
ncbi:hypothetical protein DFH09DRAFT_1270454 [Mycena vulgaris]|nr:hypothetical protein DFH09DRAFT_1270454 [Mycena vulgaris]